jgi:carboxylesterase
MALMTEMENTLPAVEVPTLVVQSSGDLTVNPVSAQLIFDRLSSSDKELALISSERHGIINGEGREKVFQRVGHFLDQLPKREVAPEVEIVTQSA